MKMIQTKKWGNLLLSVLLLASCHDGFNDDIGGGGGSNDEIPVQFTLQMPAGNGGDTFAISDIDENEVATIDVLAFIPVTVNAEHPSGYAFAYKAQVSSASIVSKPGYSKKEVKEFTVTLLKKTKPQNFVLLANVAGQVAGLGDIAVGTDKDELLKQLVFANAGSWNANNDKPDDAPDKLYVHFPMWGEVSHLIDDSTTRITDGKLLRGIARLDVVLGDDVLSAGNFYLEKLYIYNSKNQGRIVPDAANISDGKATAATLPDGNINNKNPLVYEIPAAMKNAFERSVYLFEAKAVAQNKASEATCIVVGGRFGSDTKTSYYRLDFFQADRKTYKDVLRNCRYRVNIVKVDGRGEGSATDAFYSTAINMEAQILEWDDGDFGTVTFDGQRYLNVSPASEFDFPRAAGTQLVYLKTDVPAGWKITKITESDGTTPNTGWLTTDKTTGLFYGAGEVKVPVNISVKENTTGVKRTGYIYVQAGRLEARLTVTQDITSPAGPVSLDVTSSGLPVTELVFTNKDLGPKKLDVSWLPKNADLVITNSAVSGYTAFPSTSGIPLTGTVAGGNGGTGQKSYTITAPALTAGEIASNPFVEKRSKVLFSVASGLEEVYKSVFVRYVNYALTHDLNTAGYALTNSNTYTITIKSNSSWKVASVTGDTGILSTPVANILSQQGGNNTTTGDALTFKLVTDSDGSLNGKTITITLTDPTGKVSNTTLVIKGLSSPSCGKDGTAVSRKIGNNNYLTHMYDGKCWMVQNLKEGNSWAQHYNNSSSYDSGYYYTHTQAASACPAGWHLPTSGEASTLVSAVGGGNVNNSESKWWGGVNGASNGAFEGLYNSFGLGAWIYWGSWGIWWCGSDGKHIVTTVAGLANGLYPETLYKCSVRCVQD